MVKTLGQRLRELREAADLSLRELADKVQKTPPFLSDIELGRRHPSDEVLARLAKALVTTVDDLRKYDSRPPVDEIRKRASEDPAFGFALRRVIDEKVTPAELEELLNRKRRGSP